jgi:hypothetical protein
LAWAATVAVPITSPSSNRVVENAALSAAAASAVRLASTLDTVTLVPMMSMLAPLRSSERTETLDAPTVATRSGSASIWIVKSVRSTTTPSLAPCIAGLVNLIPPLWVMSPLRSDVLTMPPVIGNSNPPGPAVAGPIGESKMPAPASASAAS